MSQAPSNVYLSLHLSSKRASSRIPYGIALSYTRKHKINNKMKAVAAESRDYLDHLQRAMKNPQQSQLKKRVAPAAPIGLWERFPTARTVQQMMETMVEDPFVYSATAQESTIHATKRYAVVTGANRGIGCEICRQLASNGILVVLTARDEKRGLEAVQKLKDSGISDDLVVFHQLDVVDPGSIASLAEFVKTKFGKLDILVNNAGVAGVVLKADAFLRAFEQTGDFPSGEQAWAEIGTQSYEMAEQCVKTNYYGAKGMLQVLAPLLQLSDSPRIVNVSSLLGLLKNIPSAWAKGLLNDVENLNEDRVDEVLNEFHKDFKEDLLESKGWPTYLSAYIVAKAAMNAYTRILAKKYPSFCVNCLCPGYCKTDLTSNSGLFTAAEGAESAVRLALLPDGGPSGCFFYQKEMLPCF